MAPSLIDMVIGLGMGINNGLLKRKATKFLDEATCDSVTSALGEIISSEVTGMKQREFLYATFDKYCVQDDASQQKHWNEASFEAHIRSTHSAAAVSDAAVLLLWRSFQFYAHHPCPRQDGKVDFEAFRRAVLLLVFQCEDIIGTQKDGYEDLWPGRAASLDRAKFQRVFRSIGAPEPSTTQTENNDWADSSVGDVMDVLIMLVPQGIHAPPPQEQLEATARRLLAACGTPAATETAIRRDEVLTLMSLLLRMRLRKEKWCWLYNLGDFAQTSPANQELTEALVRTLAGKEGDDTQIITCQQLIGAIDIIPNLSLRFHLLWAVLFLPPPYKDNTAEHAFETVPTHIGGIASLFVPRFKSDNPRLDYRGRTVNHDARLSLEMAEATPDSQNITITRLVQALSHDSEAHVVLFTGYDDIATTQRPVVVGAYFPAEAGDKKQDSKSQDDTCAHLLFQLQPIFRLLRWTKPSASSLEGLINTEEGKKVPLQEIAQSESGAPWWIGEVTGQARLSINPKEKTATLNSGGGGGSGGDEGGYRDVRECGNNGLGKDWEVTVQVARMNVLAVVGTGTPRSL